VLYSLVRLEFAFMNSLSFPAVSGAFIAAPSSWSSFRAIPVAEGVLLDHVHEQLAQRDRLTLGVAAGKAEVVAARELLSEGGLLAPRRPRCLDHSRVSDRPVEVGAGVRPRSGIGEGPTTQVRGNTQQATVKRCGQALAVRSPSRACPLVPFSARASSPQVRALRALSL
jgi:hypothetical protein